MRWLTDSPEGKALRASPWMLAVAVGVLAADGLTAADAATNGGDPPSECGAILQAPMADGPSLSSGSDAPHARPALGQAVTGSEASVCVVRATDHRVQPIEGFARVAYARTQAFNADDTLMVVVAGNEMIHLVGVGELQHRRALPQVGGIDGEPQWHPGDPRRLRYFPRDNRAAIAELDVETGQSHVLVDFGVGRLPWRDVSRITTRWEGSPSMDGRYWCLMAYAEAGRFSGVFTYDLQLDEVLGHRSLETRPDHVSMSPSGRHCVVSHERDDGGTRVWNRSFTHSRALHPASEHSDLARGANGEDFYVFVDYDTDGYLVAVDLDTLTRTRLVPTYVGGSTTAYHVSARNFERPGWVVVSTYAEKGPRNPLHGRVLAIELTPDPRVVELARHQSRFTSYWTAPVATTNRNLTRILFNSNWGTGKDEDMDVYMIVVPPGLLTRTNP